MAASPDGDFGGVTPIAGVAALARDFDGFIVDQWGVLHDGTRPYGGAVQCLEELRSAGKRVVILSNTGRRQSGNLRLMAEMGFGTRLFDGFVSAGEDARDAIARRRTPFHARLGSRYFAFTREDDASILEDLGLERVASVAQAEFLAVIGIDSPRVTMADYEPLLLAGAERKLPMICANPDVVRPSPEGIVDAPGALARRYVALGGEAFYHGKPYPAIYESCLEALAGCPRERVIAVGDSLEHDIVGASGVGLATAFVSGGIHAEELGAPWGRLPEPGAWRRLAEQSPARPDYLLPAFVW